MALTNLPYREGCRPLARHSGPRRCRSRWLGWLLAAGLFLSGASAGLAAPVRIVDLNAYQLQDLRALSMGNAFGPVARGEAALQYNPAGLATYDFDLKADASATFMEEKGNFINDTMKVSSGSPSVSELNSYFQKYSGSTQTFMLQTFPSAVANVGEAGFGFGGGHLDARRLSLSFTQATPGVYNPLTDSLTVASERAELGLGGVAFKLAGGKALVGVTSKTVRYSEANSNTPYTVLLQPGAKIDIFPTATEYNQVAAFDAGLIYRVEWLPELKPQWSLTAFNIGGYKLKGTTPAGLAQTAYVPDTYNFGLSLQPEFGFAHVLIAGEVEDLADSVKVMANGVNKSRDESQRLHSGVEVGFFKTPTGNNWFNIRGGSNQGYLTYGAEVNLGGFLRAVYSYGTENTGYKGHPQIFKFEAYQVALGVAW